jgi:magnesium chelatase subunit D
MVQALLLAAINPLCGGVLLRGEKGAAKSTAARGLREILPPLPPTSAESANPSLPRGRPFLTLPLNATEDRVVGGLDFEVATRQGIRVNNPGLLSQAHQGILYIDEVNLLDDHLVDLVLDAAARGSCALEREGLSLTLPSQFILIGTMNPEEGELRPQFLDRFGLAVQVASEKDPELRVETLRRREEFEADPWVFAAKWAPETELLKARVLKAQAELSRVVIPQRIREFIAQLAVERHVAGHRADLLLERAAVALCAFQGRKILAETEVLEVAPLVLAHRQRESAPPPPPPPDPEPNEAEANQEEPEQEEPRPEEPNQEESERAEPTETESAPPEPAPAAASPLDRPEPEDSGEEDSTEPPSPRPNALVERIFEIGQTFKVRRVETAKDRLRRRGSGRRSRGRVSQKQGRYVKSGPNNGLGDLALDATIRAAAPYQLGRERAPGLALALWPSDIRCRIREKKMGNHLFLTVDASGSMGARGRMAAAKGAVMSLLLDAYQKRDQVALISFRRDGAAVNLPLTASADLAGRLLAEMPIGGRTPLAHGLELTFREVRNALLKNPLARPIVIVVTDGRGNVSLTAGPPGSTQSRPLQQAWALASVMAREKRAKYLVVDTEEESLVAFKLAERLAAALEAEYYRINDLKAETLLSLIRAQT